MASSEAAETKTIITSLLISTPLRCTIQQLCKDFVNTVGYKIPCQRLGFNNVEDYLRSIPDTVRIYGSGLSAEVAAVVKPKSAHINELVSKQKKNTIPSHKRGRIKQFNRPSTSGNYQNQAPQNRYPRYVPSYPSNQNYSIENKPMTNNYNPRNLRPDHESRSTLLNNEPSEHISSPVLSPNCRVENPSNSLSSNYSFAEKHEKFDTKEKEDVYSDASSDYDDYENKVPPSVQNNLRKLILKFPDGIACSKLVTEYQKLFGKKLSYEMYSYRSVIEMCSDLPEIFQYTEASSDEFILYDKSRPVPSLNQNEVSSGCVSRNESVGGDILSELPKIDWVTGLNFIPQDVLHLSDRIPRYFPKDLKVGDYLDVSIGEIYDISKFWVYMTFGDLPPLMADLQTFFNNQRNKYLIPEFLLNEGLYCTTLYAGQYHRSVIVDLLPSLPGFVRVLFVDYGTVGNVPSKEIWYLPKKFGKVPCQAIRARLSNIYPVCENRTWSIQAVNKFKKLVTNVPIVGEVTRIDEDDHVLELYLADITNENKIFYINDVLVEDGHALYIGQEQKQSLMDPNCGPVVKYIHLYPEFTELESGNAPTSYEMNYLVTNKIPLHHFLPHYFDIYYDEDIEYIERQHEVFNRDSTHFELKPVSSDGKEFDFSFFPEEIRAEIETLVEQEGNAVPRAKPSEDESVREYCPNRRRISELRSGGSETSSSVNSDLSLEIVVEDVVPLNNTLQNLHLSNSNLPVINNVAKNTKSTNPFLSDEDSNPFRRTNPFLSDLEETVNSKDLFEIYAKPMENKVNNINSSNEAQSKVDKGRNVSNAGNSLEKRVRTPPGFNSGNASSVVNPAYFTGLYNNPYYQRFTQFNNMYSFTLNQMGVAPNILPPFYPNQFNPQYMQQLGHTFGAQAPPMGHPMMNFSPGQRFHYNQ